MISHIRQRVSRCQHLASTSLQCVCHDRVDAWSSTLTDGIQVGIGKDLVQLVAGDSALLDGFPFTIGDGGILRTEAGLACTGSNSCLCECLPFDLLQIILLHAWIVAPLLGDDLV